MGIKQYKPTSAGRRGASVSDFAEVTKSRPEKSLLVSLSKKGGRNNNGRITARHRGGGHRRHYRQIDFRRDKDAIQGKVAAIEYDPNRSGYIALIHYVDGEKRYILAPHGMKVGDTIMNGPASPHRPGNCLPLEKIVDGTFVHAIETTIGKGATLARSAGTFAQLMAKEGDYATLKLPSGEFRLVHVKCRATIGQTSNLEHENRNLGKAGVTRHMGRRPHVRGVVMNPVDHPLGGGEGRSSGGRHPCSPWGQPAKGYRTRRNKRTDKYIVRRRKK